MTEFEVISPRSLDEMLFPGLPILSEKKEENIIERGPAPYHPIVSDGKGILYTFSWPLYNLTEGEKTSIRNAELGILLCKSNEVMRIGVLGGYCLKEPKKYGNGYRDVRGIERKDDYRDIWDFIRTTGIFRILKKTGLPLGILAQMEMKTREEKPKDKSREMIDKLVCFDERLAEFITDLFDVPLPERILRKYPNFNKKELARIKRLSELQINTRTIKDYYIELLEYGLTPKQIFGYEKVRYEDGIFDRSSGTREIIGTVVNGHLALSKVVDFMEKNKEKSELFMEKIEDKVIDYISLSLMA